MRSADHFPYRATRRNAARGRVWRGIRPTGRHRFSDCSRYTAEKLRELRRTRR